MNANQHALVALLVWFCVVPLTARQDNLASHLAELASLRARVGSAETRVRVSALHRAWSIALASPHAEVKQNALDLLAEPLGSASDHIRMPAVHAAAEIANSTDDVAVKLRALRSLGEPLNASQVPIRDVAIEAVTSIVVAARSPDVSLAAIQALGPPLRSGNNGVRIPAINALIRAVESGRDDRVCLAAIDQLGGPLESSAAIGGMEVRMLALVALERAGLRASDVGTRARAMGLLHSYASKSGWEPEARRRASDGAAAIETSLKQ